MTINEFFHYFFNLPPNAVFPDPVTPYAITLTQVVVRVLIGVFALLLAVPPLVWWERRLLGWMQQRQGPNRVGPFGLLQTIADGLKLLFKEDMNPANVDKVLFVLAPIVFLIPSLTTPGVIPWGPSRVWGAPAPNVNVGVLYVLLWSSLAVYGVVLAGWSSNNKYSLLGGLRSSAQIISYELGMGLAIITVVLMSGSLGLQDIVSGHLDARGQLTGGQSYFIIPGTEHILSDFSAQGKYLGPGLGLPVWNVFKFFPLGAIATVIYMISMLAETNRAPFDLPEAETELVAGYHTEYTSMKFATFFLGEYANMVVVSAICATLFFGGYLSVIPWLNQLPQCIVHIYNYTPNGHRAFSFELLRLGVPWLTLVINALLPVVWFTLKVLAFLYFFIWVRATLPRLRYDMLMKFGWQGLLPISLANILLVAVGLVFGYLPALIGWAAVAAVTLVLFAKSKPAQAFTTNSRRSSTIALYADAQPYSAVAQHSGFGMQTMPPDAPSEIVDSAEVTRRAEARDEPVATATAYK